MKRLRELKNYLVENGGIKSADIVCHTANGELIPVEQETETGIHLFDERYDAVIFVEDVSEKEYNYLKLLIYDWFRENRSDDEETYRFSSDETSDLSSLITIDLTLNESTHLTGDTAGKLERDSQLYSLGDKPIPEGI